MNEPMDAFDELRHEESLAAAGLASISIGPGAIHASGLSPRTLTTLCAQHERDLRGDGDNLLLLDLDGPLVKLYVRRRRGHVAVGTRDDFKTLGLEHVCDALDHATDF
jgi:hypothetical protein